MLYIINVDFCGIVYYYYCKTERSFSMLPFERFGPKDRESVQYVLFDIDDTITTEGKVKPDAYNALWTLHDAGFYTVPVTGRPAGWCDSIIRMWPVRAIIGENGAFVYYMDGDNQVRRFEHPAVATGDYRAKLDLIKDAVLKKVPGSRVAKDQFSRIYDLAIDFNEDPPYLGLEAAERIRQICVEMGAIAKVSSIHVNTWFGSYDKLSMALLFFEQVLGITKPRNCTLFFGDSPNDEPMFGYFPYSCGVANIKPFADSMNHLPTYVTQSESGAGFCEAIWHFMQV